VARALLIDGGGSGIEGFGDVVPAPAPTPGAP
jgi:hypothetical protein